MNIRNALNSLPGRPGMVIAVVLAVIVLAAFYVQQYRICTDIGMLRAALYEKVRQNAGKKIRLSDMIPFAWQRARIITHFQSRIRLPDCPFNWDLSQRERRRMMAEAQLSVIAFATRDGNRVIDFNNEIIAFDLRETTLTPRQAVFMVERKAGGFILRQTD